MNKRDNKRTRDALTLQRRTLRALTIEREELAQAVGGAAIELWTKRTSISDKTKN